MLRIRLHRLAFGCMCACAVVINAHSDTEFAAPTWLSPLTSQVSFVLRVLNEQMDCQTESRLTCDFRLILSTRMALVCPAPGTASMWARMKTAHVNCRVHENARLGFGPQSAARKRLVQSAESGLSNESRHSR